VNIDLLPSKAARQAAVKPGQSRARKVRQIEPIDRHFRSDRTDRDDPPPFALGHPRNHVPDCPQNWQHLLAQGGFEILIRQAERVAALRARTVVDQDIGSTKAALDVLKQPLQIGRRADVAHYCRRLSTTRRDLRGHVFQFCGGSGKEHNTVALLSNFFRARTANAARCGENDRSPFSIHKSISIMESQADIGQRGVQRPCWVAVKGQNAAATRTCGVARAGQRNGFERTNMASTADIVARAVLM
jgi:hypothetical protein